MTTEMIKDSVLSIVNEYPIKKIILFGSRAEGIHREDSDVDLIFDARFAAYIVNDKIEA